MDHNCLASHHRRASLRIHAHLVSLQQAFVTMSMKVLPLLMILARFQRNCIHFFSLCIYGDGVVDQGKGCLVGVLENMTRKRVRCWAHICLFLADSLVRLERSLDGTCLCFRRHLPERSLFPPSLTEVSPSPISKFMLQYRINQDLMSFAHAQE